MRDRNDRAIAPMPTAKARPEHNDGTTVRTDGG
jgi:hypothetical protein